jgi:hypothetical protein
MNNILIANFDMFELGMLNIRLLSIAMKLKREDFFPYLLMLLKLKNVCLNIHA